MSVRSAGLTIKEARTRAGFTLEQLSEGVCSLHSLCRIESGAAGVSPATFQALMEHAGAPCQIYPIFENWNDYECFYHLTHARFHLNAWQLKPAYEELEAVEKLEWNRNKLYYQEWVLLHCKLQLYSGKANHQQIYNDLISALNISRPDISFVNFGMLLLSTNEIELLTAIAQEALYLNRPDICLPICSQINVYLSNSNFSFNEKDSLLANYAICYTQYLISTKDYTTALNIAEFHRHQMVLNGENAPLLELTFLTALSYYYCNNIDKALQLFKDTFYSAYAIESPYATICRNYICTHLDISLPEHLLVIPDIPLQTYKTKKIIDTSSFTDGVYDIYSADVITIGKLIHELRIKQNVSQQTLCQGLCSKSKLSKIENDMLQPEVILAETLLQRLGFSEREFIFWGDTKEAKFYEIKFKLTHLSYLSDLEFERYLSQLSEMDLNKNLLYKQFYLYKTAQKLSFGTPKLSQLWEALNCTLKDFDIYRITDYRLSGMELTILNNIAYAYRYTNTSYQGIIYYQKILEYRQIVQIDTILGTRVFAVSLYRFSHILYALEHHKELLDLFVQTDTSILKYSLSLLGGFYFYLCQSMEECSKNNNLLPQYIFYTCALENIVEHFSNTDIFIKGMHNDYSITLCY